MTSPERTYAVAAFIPQGKVLTYKALAHLAQVTNPRLVGSYLHKNPYPGVVPCHRVINSQGKVAATFAFGGGSAQLQLLQQEGIQTQAGTVNLATYLWQPHTVFQLYFSLLFTYGNPGSWPWFGKMAYTNEEIAISAILTQNTSWQNVEKAMSNLRQEKAATIQSLYNLGISQKERLKALITPAGFHNQKATYLLEFCAYCLSHTQGFSELSTLSPQILRNDLLSIKGIGRETADTIILYAIGKPTFVIDTYTKRFVEFYRLSNDLQYEQLQHMFVHNLPCDVALYQDYHALIIEWGKRGQN